MYYATPEVILALMRKHKWPPLRAWRIWLSYSKKEMAQRLRMAEPTYSQLEGGVVSLCEWIEPALMQRLARFRPAVARPAGSVQTTSPLEKCMSHNWWSRGL